jgi:hypothetical protein
MGEARRPGDDWPCDWESHEREQRMAIASGTTPEQRFFWLEEMIEFAYRAGALRRREEAPETGAVEARNVRPTRPA